MIGEFLFRDSRFWQEKREFWLWPLILAVVVLIAINIYRGYQTELQTKQTGALIEVPVIQKIRSNGSRGSKSKIGIMHGHVPIYIVAGSRWFRSTTVGSTTKVIYSHKYHTYLDPYKKFDVDISFMAFFIFMSLIITWRGIWLGLYIWYWN